MKPGKKKHQRQHTRTGKTGGDNILDADVHSQHKSSTATHDLDQDDDSLIMTASIAETRREKTGRNEDGKEGSAEEEGGNSGESFGKRKVEDFLRRQETTMDSKFKAFVVLPGDNVTATTTRITKNIRLGPGLAQRGGGIIATRAGMLRYRPPSSYWVESNGRRYFARSEDQVLGIVEDRMGDSYKVSIFGR